MLHLNLVAPLAALILAAAPGDAPKAPAKGADETSLESAESSYFLLRRPAEFDGEEGEAVAVVALRTLDRSHATGHLTGHVNFLLEREVVFAHGGLRVRHTETGAGQERRLVWRELLPTQCRTWVADWKAGERGARARSLSFGWNRPVHEEVVGELTGDLPVMGPLELLHGMVEEPLGEPACGLGGLMVGVVDPRSAAIVPAERQIRWTEDGAEVAAYRLDGSALMEARMEAPVGSKVPSGHRMTALRLGAGDEVATPIDAAEFRRLSSRWYVESRRPYDAVLALIPERR